MEMELFEPRYYVHPAVLDTYLAGAILEGLQNGTEAAVVRLLHRQLETQASQ